jgi:hypothetical protein
MSRVIIHEDVTETVTRTSLLCQELPATPAIMGVCRGK